MVAILDGGCLDVGAFACSEDNQCDVANGICVEGFCAVPDPGCEYEYRWVDRAPAGKAGECTGPVTDEDTTSTSSITQTLSTTSSSAEATTIDPSLGESSTTTMVHESTGMQCEADRCACAADLAVGSRHTCAIRLDDSAVCWGWNQFHQIIDEDVAEVTTPEALEVTPTLLRASERHTCAVVQGDGSVWCWGRNAEGQSAPSDIAATIGPTSDTDVVDPSALELGVNYTCAVQAPDQLTCWGDNGRFQLGTSDPVVLSTTTLPIAPLGLTTGASHACVWTDTQIWCWGDNGSSQLGVDGPNRIPTPTLLAETSGIVAVAAGNNHTCASIEGGTEVWCVGQSDSGQLGTVLPDPVATPTVIQGLPDATVVELHARIDSNCARFDDDQIWCWGGTEGDFLGTSLMNNNEPLVPPRRVVVRDEFDTEGIMRMGLGSQHICVLTDAMRVHCWGNDADEQLGPVDPPTGSDSVELDLLCML